MTSSFFAPMSDIDAERGNVEVRIRGNVEVETPLTGQTAAVLTPSDDSDQAGVTASMSRSTGASDFGSQLLKAEIERLLTMFE